MRSPSPARSEPPEIFIGFIFLPLFRHLEFLWLEDAHDAAGPGDRPCFSKGCKMAFDYILSGMVTVFITVYLAYALWRPERF